MVLDWSSLPDGIWSLIFGKLPIEDYIRCRSVCSLWLSIVHDLKQCSSEPRVPWLMIPDHCYGEVRYTTFIGDPAAWKLLDMAYKKVHKITVPDLIESTILGSSEGWLVLADNNTSDLRLFNLFTRAKIHLPPTTTFPDVVATDRDSEGRITNYRIWNNRNQEFYINSPHQVNLSFFRSAFLSSWESSYTVVVEHGFENHLAMARAGDKSWTPLQIPGGVRDRLRCTFSKGMFSLLDREEKVVSFNLSSSNNNNSKIPLPSMQVAPPPPPPVRDPPKYMSQDVYLTLSPKSGELMMLRKTSSYLPKRDSREMMDVFRLDRETVEWVEVEVRSLHGHSFFRAPWGISRYQTMTCLGAKGVEGNCLYYADDDGYLKVFDLEIQRSKHYRSTLIRGGRDRNCRQPFWIAPSLVNFPEND